MQPNSFSKIKDKNSLKQLLRSHMNFVPLVSGHALSSLHLLASPEQVFFFSFQRKLRSTLIAAAILKAIIAKLREEGQAKGREKRGKLFSLLSPSPSSILIHQPLSWWQEKISIMFHTANYACFAGYHLLSSNCFHKNTRGLFLPLLEPTHPQEQSCLDLVEYLIL